MRSTQEPSLKCSIRIGKSNSSFREQTVSSDPDKKRTPHAGRVLVYKMTHPGDPHPHPRETEMNPVWGREDCMGEVRGRGYRAVIGTVGIGDLPKLHHFDSKLLWIGVGPRPWKVPAPYRGPLITFDRYVWFGEQGESLWTVAPTLAKRMLGKNARVVMDFIGAECAEVEAILARAANALPSHPENEEEPAVPRLRSAQDSCGCEDVPTW